jgi:aladin
LKFHDNLIFTALPIVDLSKVEVEGSEIGGVAQQLAWNGKYLAISYKETNSISIFQTTIRKHQLNVVPIGLVSKSASFEFPTFITFQPNYDYNSDNILTVAWSSGEIQFVPFN